MKIAIPSFDDSGLESDISAHFGHTSYYTIVTLADEKLSEAKVIANIEDGPHSCANPVNLLNNEGVELVLLSNIGPSPLEMLQQLGIEVLCGAFGKVKDALNDYLDGALSPVDKNNSCNCNHDH
ncbi:MAG: NifB/NifX family molybdenum-iron cluster-binding protein [Halobacteriota archaeon]|nr:NifB/NifX family molybdenum-iron cluster-binding protein [Halobacteriota archaeon]